MKYGTYNEELGYSNGPEFNNAFDAINSAWGKCRRHSVQEYSDDGAFIRTLSRTEENEIWEREAAKAPAHHRVYLYRAATPLMGHSEFAANDAIRQPYKDLADKYNIEWGENTITSYYTDLPQKGGTAIAIRVQLSLPSEFKAAVDAQAKESRCPWVLTYNKYHKLVCTEKFSQEG